MYSIKMDTGKEDLWRKAIEDKNMEVTDKKGREV
jgi:hypothetical protein